MTDRAKCINILGKYCGIRDVNELSAEELKRIGLPGKADVCVLFGGSIIAGGDVFAQAMKNCIAEKYIIVGGAGHTTQTLRDIVHGLYEDIDTEGKPEAEIFAAYLQKKYGLVPDLLETRSTNCGNNITNLLALMEENGIVCRSIILIQDATMQRRMDAGMRKYRQDMKIVNYAAYSAEAVQIPGGSGTEETVFSREIPGMWTTERYTELLMGEIPRLRDDEEGYGPRGKDYIAHTEVSPEVIRAFEELRMDGADVRAADPAYSTEANRI